MKKSRPELIREVLEDYFERAGSADATLVILSGHFRTRQVLTLDAHDFDIYRTIRGQTFEKI